MLTCTKRLVEQVQGEHGHLVVFPVGAGEIAVFAVEQHGVAGVPLVYDLRSIVYLAAQLRGSEVVAGEHRAHRSAEFFQSVVGGVSRPAAGEPPQDRLRSAVPSRSAVAYLTVWSYCWAMRSHLIGRMATGPRCALAASSPGRYRRMEPVFFNAVVVASRDQCVRASRCFRGSAV